MSSGSKRVGACAPEGFVASGVSAGIKKSGKLDLSVLYSTSPAYADAVFTTNRVQAAPIQVSRQHLKDNRAQAIIFSSGNANAATGEKGRTVALAMCEKAAEKLSLECKDVLIAQTGLIGLDLDQEIAVQGTALACENLGELHGLSAAEAMMTTDTVPKISSRTFEVNGKTVTAGGMAKGAAMLSPAMATMLAVVTTDANVSPGLLKNLLRSAMYDSFHAISVDGCMSTNDTVFILANGQAENNLIESEQSEGYPELQQAVNEVCKDLALQMIKDAEGATKFLTVHVHQAKSESDARKVAEKITNSALCKCALAGEKAYWGRVIAETGASGAEFEQEQVSIAYGEDFVCMNGIECEHDEVKVARYMKNRDITIHVHLGAGDAESLAYGCDLTHGYVDENMGLS